METGSGSPWGSKTPFSISVAPTIRKVWWKASPSTAAAGGMEWDCARLEPLAWHERVWASKRSSRPITKASNCAGPTELPWRSEFVSRASDLHQPKTWPRISRITRNALASRGKNLRGIRGIRGKFFKTWGGMWNGSTRRSWESCYWPRFFSLPRVYAFISSSDSKHMPANDYPAVVVAGPTASGKSRLGMALAKKHRGEVLSCDALQIYRGMDIGTAKPAPAERESVPHHMLDLRMPGENFSAGDYQRLGREAL